MNEQMIADAKSLVKTLKHHRAQTKLDITHYSDRLAQKKRDLEVVEAEIERWQQQIEISEANNG